jgi:tetratricopeptide (TPR) repeat protein
MPFGRASILVAGLALVACGRAGGGVAQPAAPAHANAGAPNEAARLLREARQCHAEERALATPLYALGEALGDAPEAQRADLQARIEQLEARARTLRGCVVASYARVADDPRLATWPEREQVLLDLARALRELGRGAEAEARFLELTRAFPESASAAAAYLALAELAFASERLQLSIEHADRAAALSSSDADLDASARYIASWGLRALGDDRRPGALGLAMQALREVVRLAPRMRQTATWLVPSAEQELVELYAAHGDPAQAEPFFGALEHATAERLLRALHARYERRDGAPVAL